MDEHPDAKQMASILFIQMDEHPDAKQMASILFMLAWQKQKLWVQHFAA